MRHLPWGRGSINCRGPVTSTTVQRMNRLTEYLEDPEEEVPSDDYCWIETFSEAIAVSREAAAGIERELDRPTPPRWVIFRDIAGARHRLLAHLIEHISESTAAQRAANRAFRRARKLEDKADRRPWEED